MAEERIRPVKKLRGRVVLPGDKSISHRALLISALADGVSTLKGVQKGADCRATLQALTAFRVEIKEEGEKTLVFGRGSSGWQEPNNFIDCANSGTTIRLLAGAAAGQPFTTFFTGDDSLRERPMARLCQPLRQMGARVLARNKDYPPLVIAGGRIFGIHYQMPVASAQVKSCLLLAGLLAEGKTAVTEPATTRDHTERMLVHFGAQLQKSGLTTTISGGQHLTGQTVEVPGDFSAAAFFLAASAVVPEAELFFPGVGLNPTRTAFLEVLRQMGVAVECTSLEERSGEPVGSLIARSSPSLKGITVAGASIPNLIDEIPLLAVVGLAVSGQTEVRDAAELRVKESDRIAAIVTELRKMGAEIEERPDGFLLNGPQRLKGGMVHSHGDHRIAMALAVAGLFAEGETVIQQSECVSVSFPNFFSLLASLGG